VTRLPSRAEIEAALTASPASLDQHNELIAHAERRLARAREKVDAAAMEMAEAMIALGSAKAARDEFIANNPDPQLEMPI
jgi:hypothetical protein